MLELQKPKNKCLNFLWQVDQVLLIFSFNICKNINRQNMKCFIYVQIAKRTEI